MMASATQLPPGFEDLEQFVDYWSVAGIDERKKRRIMSTDEQRQEFYAAGSRHLVRALDYLDQYPIDDLENPQQSLLNLMLSLAQVSLAVEKQGSNEAYHARSHAHFTISRSTEDAA